MFKFLPRLNCEACRCQAPKVGSEFFQANYWNGELFRKGSSYHEGN